MGVGRPGPESFVGLAGLGAYLARLGSVVCVCHCVWLRVSDVCLRRSAWAGPL